MPADTLDRPLSCHGGSEAKLASYPPIRKLPVWWLFDLWNPAHSLALGVRPTRHGDWM